MDADPAASDEVIRHVGKRAIPQLVIDGEWFQPYKPGRGLLYDEMYKRLNIPRPDWQSLELRPYNQTWRAMSFPSSQSRGVRRPVVSQLRSLS